MKRMKAPGIDINEHSDRDREIQLDLLESLNNIALIWSFTWTAPTHDIVRRLMNEVHEFKPAAED